MKTRLPTPDVNITWFTRSRLLGRFVNVYQLQHELIVLLACITKDHERFSTLAEIEDRANRLCREYQIELEYEVYGYLNRMLAHRLVEYKSGAWRITKVGVACVQDHTRRYNRHELQEKAWAEYLRKEQGPQATNTQFDLEQAETELGPNKQSRDREQPKFPGRLPKVWR